MTTSPRSTPWTSPPTPRSRSGRGRRGAWWGPTVAAAAAACASLTSSASSAQADVISLRAEAHVGGAGGAGLGGDRKDEAFFAGAPHLGYGVLIGAEFVFVDAWIQHHQLTNGSRLATWTELGAGFDIQLGLGGGAPAGAKGGEPAPAKAFAEFGLGVAFGLGTGQQVDPPLSADELTDKGFTGHVSVGLGYHLSRVLDVGIRAPLSAGYFFKSGQGAVANDLSTHYTAMHGEVIAFLRFQIKAK
jgi:hypothetical protein